MGLEHVQINGENIAVAAERKRIFRARVGKHKLERRVRRLAVGISVVYYRAEVITNFAAHAVGGKRNRVAVVVSFRTLRTRLHSKRKVGNGHVYVYIRVYIISNGFFFEGKRCLIIFFVSFGNFYGEQTSRNALICKSYAVTRAVDTLAVESCRYSVYRICKRIRKIAFVGVAERKLEIVCVVRALRRVK